MLGIEKVGRGREDYYLSTVAAGRRHDGGLIEPDGVWLGGAAGAIGLDGPVLPGELRAVLAGVHPHTGASLSASHARGRVRVMGYDFTFSTPKSLSVLHALGPVEGAGAVRDAHEGAVAAVVDYLERHGARWRRPGPRGRAGPPDHRISLPAQGLVVASFVHRTSRAPDPHLHSHVLVVNCVPGHDGRWSPLDGRALYVEATSVGNLYEAEVRQRVHERLGLRFGMLRGASADLDGIEVEVLRAFSRRSAEIATFLERRGLSGPRARHYAARATRRPKDLTVSHEELVAEWRERALDLGLAAGKLDRLVEAGLARAGRPDPLRDGEVLRGVQRALGPDGLTAERASFTRSDLVRAGCRAAPAGAAVAEVESAVDAVVRSPAVVERGAGARSLRGAGGKRIPAPATELRYTTPEVLAIEASIVSIAAAARGRGVAVVGEQAVASSLGRRQLKASDRETALRLLSSGDGVEVVRVTGGPPDAVEAARAGWEAEGAQVFGVAPTGPGARRLEATTGIESVPLDALGRSASALRHSASSLPAGSVLAVGGAARVGPRRLAVLLEGAAEARLKVLLVTGRLDGPDDRTLASIAATSAPLPAVATLAPERGSRGCSGEVRWCTVGPVRVGLAASAGEARRALLETWLEFAENGRAAVVVVDDAPTAAAIRDAGCGPVVRPGDLPPALGGLPEAAVVVLGAGGALPAAVRRNQAIERVHVATVRSAEAGDIGRAAEIALPRPLVRELGGVPRTFEGRAIWRAAAEASLGRDRLARERLEPALGALRELPPERTRARGGLER